MEFRYRVGDTLHELQLEPDGEGWIARIGETTHRVTVTATEPGRLALLIDGRSVYSSLFSGVFWQVQDLAMQDIERIEVVRGPGGVMWGANAVNGVINIITKRADQLDGSTTRVLVGDEIKLVGTVRSGGPLGDGGHLRTYLKTTSRDGMHPPATGIEGDGESTRGGFRADWDLGDAAELTVQGDVYREEQVRSEEVFIPSAPFLLERPSARRYDGGNLLARWAREGEDGTRTSVQSYFDHAEIESEVFSEARRNIEVDFQRQLPWGERHSLMWGVTYRNTHADVEGSPTIDVLDEHRSDDLFGAFVQDEFRVDDDLRITYGAKIEHNEYTGVEVQPSARFSLARGEDTTIWGAVSRAVRTPAQINEDLQFVQGVLPGTPPGFNTILLLTGNEDAESEELLAYELGFRTRPAAGTSLDVAAFVHQYDNLSTAEFGTATVTGPGEITQPIFFDNLMEGIGYGAEVVTQTALAEDWVLHAGYSLLLLDLDVDEDSTSVDSGTAENEAPRNQFHVRSYHDLGETTELDVSLWYVDNLGQEIDSYVRGDVRYGWRPCDGARLSVGVQGLFHDDEQEFVTSEFGEYYGAEVGVYVQLDLSF